MDNIDIEANIGDQKLLLTHLEAVNSLSFSLISSFLYNGMATESSLSVPRLLGHIKLIKAEAILVEYRTHQIGLMDPMKDLFQELGFFITFFTIRVHPVRREKGTDFVKK
ncbi:hypothetical protein ACH5RR_036476 [Cinchona calisaya]|uniref:Uncharacterized protein n=1 Tax=Cinchona calisaya TaxID=153742 RepID=A0ABD2Y6I0_9GENT